MHPVLRKVSDSSLVLTVLLFSASLAPAQRPPSHPISNVSSRAGSPPDLDPTSEELFAMGPNGKAIEEAREQVLVLLTETSSCSRWFLSSDPDAVERFRSLRYAIDLTGASTIKKLASWRDDPDYYYEPYVARAGQNVGSGSTITLNAYGAFFKSDAPVQIVNRLDSGGYFVSFRTLRVGGYTGATLQARMLSLLHELGHVLDLLPLDAGFPSGPQLSVHNTQEVLHYCGPQIDAQARLVRSSRTSKSLLSYRVQPAILIKRRF